MSRSTEFEDVGGHGVSAAVAHSEWSVWEDLDVDPRALTVEMGKLLYVLDGMELESTEERLVTVARALGEVSRAALWSLYRVDQAAGYPAAVLARRQHRRPCPVSVPDDLDVELHEVVDDAGLIANRRSGPDRLRARLLRSGLREMLLLGGYGPDADQWVLEIGADDMSFNLLTLMPTFFPVVQAGLSYPRSARRAMETPLDVAGPRLRLVDDDLR